jgi:hypothetical protein
VFRLFLVGLVGDLQSTKNRDQENKKGYRAVRLALMLPMSVAAVGDVGGPTRGSF